MRLEAEACACGGLEEERGHHFVAEDFLFGILLESFGDVQHLDVLLLGEVGDGDEVASFECAHNIIVYMLIR